MNNIYKEEWVKTIGLKMVSIYTNLVWELVARLDGVKPRGWKWIYKKKRGVNERIKTSTARLVAEGYTKVDGVNYEINFSYVVMLKSIWIRLFIAIYYDYEIWKMCVKTTFLNDNLDENIYRGQLEGFIKQRSKEKGLQVEMIHLWIETCI